MKGKRIGPRPPQPDRPVRGQAIPAGTMFAPKRRTVAPSPLQTVPEGPEWCDIPSDPDRDWVSLADAGRLLSPAYDEGSAASELLSRIHMGVMEVSCRRLIYRNSEYPVEARHYDWPGKEARLGEQMFLAYSRPDLSNFSLNFRTGRGAWYSPLNTPPTLVMLFDAVVDRVEVLAILGDNGPAAPRVVQDQSDKVEAVIPKASYDAVKQAVRAMYAGDQVTTQTGAERAMIERCGKIPGLRKWVREEWGKCATEAGHDLKRGRRKAN